MKLSALATSITDTAVIELAKRIRRKRLSLATNPFIANSVPLSSGQGWLRRVGLERADLAASPEITVAKMLQEWRRHQKFQRSLGSGQRHYANDAEAAAHALESLNNTLRYMEYRVFGNNPNEKYPRFESFVEWMAWRVQVAHPEHHCADEAYGWTYSLYDFALSESELAFD